ncbi:rhomboid family intramembrane serine protease [Sinorhizobium terangae]|uniref:Rhomboid family intramembrane serine protease n=1 Tax=Sinorhizobium terangae TaxID=110322 RepID=A0A6N7LIP6_SINTE|nr:rhomboid family intramembrane serine protease [Sinorhizobium terangae]MBB4185872.1 membrane associated rhomboid family serine protease [Sinorhizobium terangae]MQX17751.1 rhomboid family intramembrane serine protease [Sinorhizobium terangae]WFU46873.1 rhomboid family intramembrane serine protease [Sinorhizobium terangae]
MFIPLHDSNALKHISMQYVTIALIATNVAVWLVTGPIATEEFANAAVLGLGYIPAVIFEYADLDPSLVIVPDQFTFVTYSFLHGDFSHLAMNMLFLWVFGDNVEDALGHFRFLVFYLLCAAAGALAHGLLDPASEAPLIGASGAISGVVAAYFLLHPKVRVWVLVLFRIPLPLPAAIPLAFWIGQQFYMLVVDPGSGVSWSAHVGGIVAGLLLVVALRRRGVPLFDRTIVSPRAVEHREERPADVDVSTASTRKPPTPWGRPT